MHRTESDNSVLDGSGNKVYSNGPPGTTVDGAEVTTWQEELCHVIEQAGITLKTRATEINTQLYDAILQLISDTTVSGSGYLSRSKFELDKVGVHDKILIHPGKYHHKGTAGIGQILYWESILTYTCVGLVADTISYLYIDDSSLTPGIQILTTANFIDSVTPPTWNNTKLGWYNGQDRCIFAVNSDGTPEILHFMHDGGRRVKYGVDIEDYPLSDVDSVWTNATLTVPNFGEYTQAEITIEGKYVTSGGGYLYISNQVGITGNVVSGFVDTNTRASFNTYPMFTDSSLRILIKMEVGGLSEMGVRTTGYFLPGGM